MKLALRCLLAVAIVCGRLAATEEEFKNLQIEKPDDCHISISASLNSEHSLICPGFVMEMKTFTVITEPTDRNPREESLSLISVVKCSNNSRPYEYLRLTNSKRFSLMLEGCSPPDHGSFGEGWPNLETFKFETCADIAPLTRQHFSELNNITTLLLGINSMHQLDDDILSDLTNLTEIHMAVRNVNKKMFKNLIKLEWLHLTIGSRESLDNFDMSEMKHLPELKTLELTAISFPRLTKRFFEGADNVETLIFYDNKIDGIDGNAFEPLTNLKHISIKWNELTSFPEGLLSKNTKLETFVFISLISSGVGITSLPSGFFSNLLSLREIVFESQLTSIPANLIRGSTNLEYLNLQSNRLSSMPRDLLKNHSKLKKIELYGNRFGDTTSTDLFDSQSESTKISFSNKW